MLPPRFDKMINLNSDPYNLREPTAFEIVATDGEWVEFKIICFASVIRIVFVG